MPNALLHKHGSLAPALALQTTMTVITDRVVLGFVTTQILAVATIPLLHYYNVHQRRNHPATERDFQLHL